MTAREQRLVFGEVADLYDRARPTYPDELVSDVVAAVGREDGPVVTALEIGAGTGKATALFAARGLAVHALEPDEAMAALARRNCASFPSVTVDGAGFEDWDGRGRRFDLVFAAQAWHWLTPEVRATKAAALLGDGGWLALFWNLPRPLSEPLRSAIQAVYDRVAPGLDEGGPAARAMPVRDDPRTDLDQSGWFEPVDVRRYPWVATYTTAGYLDLLGTHSDHRMLAEADRAALFDGVGRAVEEHGGLCRRRHQAVLYLARKRRAT